MTTIAARDVEITPVPRASSGLVSDTSKQLRKFDHRKSLRTMLIRKLARQFGAGGRESKSEDYVQTIFKVVATVLVLVFYFYPALVTTDLCNTTDAEIELHLPYGDNLLPTNAVVLCGHDYAIIANSYILWVVIAGAVHWILASWFWTRSKEFRGVWNISVGWNIIFFAIMLIQSTSLSSHRYADLKNYWWVWLYLGFEILIWLYLIFYALYAWYSLRVARRQRYDLMAKHRAVQPLPFASFPSLLLIHRYNLRDLDVQPLPFASQRDADVQVRGAREATEDLPLLAPPSSRTSSAALSDGPWPPSPLKRRCSFCARLPLLPCLGLPLNSP